MRHNTDALDKIKLLSNGCTTLRKDNQALVKQLEELRVEHRKTITKLKYENPEAFSVEFQMPMTEDDSASVL